MRFLFCSFSSPGFLFPLIGLAAELRLRGHDIDFASGLPAKPVLEKAGFSRVPRGTADGESFEISRWHHPLANAIDGKHAEFAIHRERPDAIVTHHLCVSALTIGERHGLPVAVMGPFSYLYPALSHAAPMTSEAEARLRWRLGDTIRVLNAVRELFRLPPAAAAPEDHPLLGALFMLRTTPRLERRLDALPVQVHTVGPCNWEPAMGEGAAEEAWSALRARFAFPDAPLIYVHNGRSFDGPTFWPALVEALGSAPPQVVGSVGRMDTELGPLPANFVVGEHIPQGVVLPRARAVVAGGHTSVVIGAALHGVPSVLIPHGVETPENAERMHSAGCAVRLDINGITAIAIRDAVDRALTDAGIRQRCLALRDEIRASDSFERAASLTEIMARTGARVPRSAAANDYRLRAAQRAAPLRGRALEHPSGAANNVDRAQ